MDECIVRGGRGWNRRYAGYACAILQLFYRAFVEVVMVEGDKQVVYNGGLHRVMTQIYVVGCPRHFERGLD